MENPGAELGLRGVGIEIAGGGWNPESDSQYSRSSLDTSRRLCLRRVAGGHLGAEPDTDGQVRPTQPAGDAHDQVRLQPARLGQLEQNGVVHLGCIGRNAVESGAHRRLSRPQHLRVTLLLEFEYGEDPLAGLREAGPIEVVLEMVGTQFGECDLQAEGVAHSQCSPRQHASEVARLDVRRYQRITEHVAQGVHVVRNRIDGRQRLCNRLQLVQSEVDPTIGQPLEQFVVERADIGADIDVEDARQS